MTENMISGKLKELCSAMPTFGLEYCLKETIEYPKSGKISKLMSTEGSFEIPLVKLIAVIGALTLICGTVAAVGKMCGKDQKAHKHHCKR